MFESLPLSGIYHCDFKVLGFVPKLRNLCIDGVKDTRIMGRSLANLSNGGITFMLETNLMGHLNHINGSHVAEMESIYDSIDNKH